MKQFFKTVLAVIVAMLIMGLINGFMCSFVFLAVGLSSQAAMKVPTGSALFIDMSKITLAEQTTDADLFSSLGSGQTQTQTIGVWDAVSALKRAAEDPRIDYVYVKADGANGGMAQIEEFRSALVKFHGSGKPVLAYIENPSNASYYVASAADKVLMTDSEGGTNTLVGISSQMVFLKDILDKLGINIQLIRHGKYKSAGEMYVKNDISPENRLQYETLIGSIWEGWSTEMSAARDLSPERFNEMLDNLELNTPEDFLNAGLVDELLDKAALESKLAAYSAVKDFDEVKFIGLKSYIDATAPNVSLTKDRIAVIYVDGEIVDGDAKQQVAGSRFAQIIDEVRRNKSVKAVVFRVNSPGGSVLASEKIKKAVDRLAAEKPVVASYSDYAASGGYWISNSCQKIYCDKSTLTGSIGVFSMIPDLSKTAKDLAHVGVVTIGSNKHSDMYSLMRPLDQAELDYMQSSVENIYDKFVDIVAEGRSLDRSFVDSIAQGRVWAGTDALEVGLVDEIGSLEDALEYVASLIDPLNGSHLSSYEVEAFPKPLSALEQLLEMFGAGENVLAGTPFEDVEEAFRGIDLTASGKVYARLPYNIEIQ